jgi:hypothetical protein
MVGNTLTKRDLLTLRQLLDKDWINKTGDKPETLSRFRITMDNDYLAPNGTIIKKQHLEADFRRQLQQPLTRWSIGLLYIWEKIRFSAQDKNKVAEPIFWGFAEGLQFEYYRTFSFPIASESEIILSQNDTVDYQIGNWYESLVTTPAVNLLYMLTWDVIMFEEYNSSISLSADKMRRIGSVAVLDIISGSNVQLTFKGCSAEDSFFKNGRLFVRFLGFGMVADRCAAIYEYRSIGRLNVRMNNNEVTATQKGESFFTGKVCVDVISGDYLFADMIELLTVTISNRQGKIIPMQKRRIVQVQKNEETGEE